MLSKEEISQIINDIFVFLHDSNLNLELIDKEFIINTLDENKSDNINKENFLSYAARHLSDFSTNEYEYSKLSANIYNYEAYLNYEKYDNKYSMDIYSERVRYICDVLKEKNIDFIDVYYNVFVQENSAFLNNLTNKCFHLPKYLDNFGYTTLKGAYLIKIDEKCIENPTDMLMRTSINMFYKSYEEKDKILDNIEKSFNYMYKGYYIHATPSLFNSCSSRPQLSSCYLLELKDSIEHIYKTLKDVAHISKWSGGVGFSTSNIRANSSMIRGTLGESSGIMPMLKNFDQTSIYVNQGGRGAKRPGAFAAFLEPWHADIEDFLHGRIPHDPLSFKKLNIALWVCDLFFEKTEKNEDWYLMCPDECPGLTECYGKEFEELYQSYVDQGKYKKVVKPRHIWNLIVKSLASSGLPYIVSKDRANMFSNQKNIGVIKSSNLCCEILEVANEDNHAVCNLASISVKDFLNEDRSFNHKMLGEVTRHITKSLNNVIDINHYPTKEAKNSNINARPIGIGIQGVADLFFKLKIPYESDEAIKLEAEIMETIYYNALFESCNLAKFRGKYNYFDGSDYSKGILQFDYHDLKYPQRYDWDNLKKEIIEYGTLNSLLISPMPTASTSQILGNYECFEPCTSNSIVRQTAYGYFPIFNKYLIEDLKKLNLWSESIKNRIISDNGSVQNIEEIPENIKNIYKTVWEIKQKNVMDHAIARAPYIDQSQSMNLHFDNITDSKILSAMMYAYKGKLKTYSYYTRSRAAAKPPNVVNVTKIKKEEPTVCESCSA